MAKLTSLSLPDAQRFGCRFGLDVIRVEALDAGSVNSNFRLWCADGSHAFARVYEEQGVAGAQAELTLLLELAELGIPTTVPLTAEDGEQVVLHCGKPLSFYPWIPGLHLCHAWVTETRARVLGEHLARVHQATARVSQVPKGRFGVQDLVLRLDRIAAEAPAFSTDVEHIRQRLAATLARRKDVPSGLTHGDLFRDNVLWSVSEQAGVGPVPSDEVAALLDFESACEGPFIYDLMVCVLSWCYTTELVQPKARAMISGYQTVRRLSAEEIEQLPVEGAMACLRFATTRITDFAMRTPAGQEPARDYRRFLKRLAELEAGVLSGAIS